ncbi:hypothetical protein CLV58_12538 [Spirosoma oryzae]|uniref:Uncharacterized protein n=1 Tax=Spirosoma oryzae TaxID=1469603 RepID=A0A2T0S8R1_9BACT|nr:hypothetical protein [Spirosoma oryzae]PRY29776.1 hypothetical protein CLV58_12538 [Spirosoma oryzae]
MLLGEMNQRLEMNRPEVIMRMSMGELSALLLFVDREVSIANKIVRRHERLAQMKIKEKVDPQAYQRARDDVDYWAMVTITVQNELRQRVKANFILERLVGEQLPSSTKIDFSV